MSDKLYVLVLVLGDLLTKRPATKKVEQFMASQVQSKVDSMILDSKIQKQFEGINERIQARL